MASGPTKLFSKKLIQNNSREGIYIASQKSAYWHPERAELPFRSTARSTGITVIFMTIVPSVDRPINRQKPSVDRPVDRPPPESGVLLVDRPHSQPTE